eukprot:8095307-Alexandrium_andersonii.AAC.1
MPCESKLQRLRERCPDRKCGCSCSSGRPVGGRIGGRGGRSFERACRHRARADYARLEGFGSRC